MINKICKMCKKEFKAERKRREYCSKKCSAQNSTRIAGKMAHIIPKIQERNGNWKNGISKDNYHYKKIQKARYPEKIKARDKVQRAIKSGKLIKPDNCSNCKERTSRVQAHHEDYNQPLKVEWLCIGCHRLRHG